MKFRCFNEVQNINHTYNLSNLSHSQTINYTYRSISHIEFSQCTITYTMMLKINNILNKDFAENSNHAQNEIYERVRDVTHIWYTDGGKK